MPRKRKTSQNGEAQANGNSAPAAEGSATAPASKKKRTPRRKAAAAPVVSETAATDAAQISDEAIRMRAYFLAEERLRLALPGDEASDWLEARRQLLAEQGES